MSQSIARSICLALVGGAALAIANVSLFPSTAASSEGCAWERHTKPVVKKVRRHGRLRRVKRVKRWWTCEVRPATSAPAAVPPAPPTPPTPPAEEPQPKAFYLGVKAVEYSYTLSRPEVSVGEVTVELNNQGEDPHNLVLEREGSADPPLEIPATPSLSQASDRFTLSAGTYLLYCSLYKHEAKGMQATLVVGVD